MFGCSVDAGDDKVNDSDTDAARTGAESKGIRVRVSPQVSIFQDQVFQFVVEQRWKQQVRRTLVSISAVMLLLFLLLLLLSLLLLLLLLCCCCCCCCCCGGGGGGCGLLLWRVSFQRRL